jgi:hypothetical protein
MDLEGKREKRKNMLIALYMMLTAVMGVSALLKGAIYPGIAGIVGPTLCWFAASGLKGSLMVGTTSQKLGGIGATLVALAVGLGVSITRVSLH